MSYTVLAAIAVIAIVALVLVALLLFVKKKVTPSGTVRRDINDGSRTLEVEPGSNLMGTLAQEDIFLASACGGKANCGQCKVQVEEGGGEILPTEAGFFNRKQVKDNWRLGCQVKVKDDIKIRVDESALNARKFQCQVISNRNVATYIKEFTVRLPETMDFRSGQYIQVDVPAFHVRFSDFDIAPEYRAEWEKFGFTNLECVNTEPTVRAYSMASYPAEGDILKLNVRIATPPRGMAVSPGIASSYIFSLKPGDSVTLSGPYGDFLLPQDDAADVEYIFVGGGAGMAPLRSHIMHLFRTLGTTRKVSFFYGARALREAFYLEDFAQLERDFPNFRFHLALDRPDPEADAAGVAYTAGFVHNVMYENCLKYHDAPEDVKYFMCGPPMMVSSVTNLLDSLGVSSDNILFDNF